MWRWRLLGKLDARQHTRTYHRGGLMDNRLRKDLKRIVMMYWSDEKSHWEELDNDENHIFISLNNVRNYLISKKKKDDE
tara:strand:+ start:3393 stop:3629 length:237 start_codon:yes stop_codon:yes gene_type:complete